MTPDLDAARAALADDPDDPSLRAALARALMDAAWRRGADMSACYAEAIAIWEALLAADPENPVLLVNLGAALSDRGKHRRALKLSRRAEALGWEDRNLEHNIGVALLNSGDREEGRRRIRASAGKERHPETVAAWFDPHAH